MQWGGHDLCMPSLLPSLLPSAQLPPRHCHCHLIPCKLLIAGLCFATPFYFISSLTPSCLCALQLFKAYDKDKSGTLEMREIMTMCRQLAGLAYNEACFVQVSACVTGQEVAYGGLMVRSHPSSLPFFTKIYGSQPIASFRRQWLTHERPALIGPDPAVAA